jgi:uncharacterized OB-fold protein
MSGEAFHAHLDICARCASQPFNLCEVGAELLRAAGIENDQVAEFPIEMSDERKAEFLHAAKSSGMRETACDTCGTYLLTRGEADRCPPCRRERANVEERAVVVCNAALASVEPGPKELDQVLALIDTVTDDEIGAEPQQVRARAKTLARAVLEQCNAERDAEKGVRT